MDQISVALHEVAVAFEHLSVALKRDVETAPKVKVEPETESTFVKSDKPAPPIEEVKKTAEDISTPMKLEVVRACLAELSQAGHTKEVKELLKKYGANKLSAIKPENYVDLMKDAQAITNAA